MLSSSCFFFSKKCPSCFIDYRSTQDEKVFKISNFNFQDSIKISLKKALRSSSGQHRKTSSHLHEFSSRPRLAAPSITFDKSAKATPTMSPKFPSSRYQKLKSEEKRSIRSMIWSEKSGWQSGSPCWTPFSYIMTILPKNK